MHWHKYTRVLKVQYMRERFAWQEKGSEITMVTLRCGKCPRLRQVALTGFLDEGTIRRSYREQAACCSYKD